MVSGAVSQVAGGVFVGTKLTGRWSRRWNWPSLTKNRWKTGETNFILATVASLMAGEPDLQHAALRLKSWAW
jgi:hypothetical protein